MADSRPAVTVTPTWQDVATLTGIPAGTQISIQNLSRFQVMVAVSAVEPSTDEIYEVLQPYFFDNSIATISAGNNQVWLRGDGLVSIQEV